MREWVKELGWRWILQRLIGVMSMSEEDKTHNQRLSTSPRSMILDKLAISDGIRGVNYWINWLFLMAFFLMLQ